MSRIEELYAEYTTQDEYVYTDTSPRIKKDRAKVKISLNNLKKVVEPGTLDKLDYNIMALAVAYEQQGFVMGFQYAMRLAKECFA